MLFVGALLGLAPAGQVRAAERSANPLPVRIAIVSKSTLDLPFWVARERGFFRDEGLAPEVVLMRSNLTLQAMAGGSVDFGTATGAAINAIVSGADLRVVMAMSDKPAFDLIAHPSITSIRESTRQKNRFRRRRQPIGNYSAPDLTGAPDPD